MVTQPTKHKSNLHLTFWQHLPFNILEKQHIILEKQHTILEKQHIHSHISPSSARRAKHAA